MTQQTTYQLPDLPYDFHELEPVISREIMELHYTKHHRAYVTNLNLALEKYQAAEAKNDIEQMIALQSAIKFNGGGHVNHSIFWSVLSPVSKMSQDRPSGKLLQMIDQDFGSFDAFKEKLSTATVAIQGSGWGWLGLNKSKKLEIATCANQDPLSNLGLIPLMGIDVWEHAYYLQYKNVRADYVKEMWKIIHWKEVESRLQKSLV